MASCATRWWAAAAGLGLVAWSAPAFAHPHIFIEGRATVVFDDAGPKEVKVEWIFDKMFSSMLRLTFAKGEKTPFGPEIHKRFEAKAFVNVKDAGYMIDARLDAKGFTFKDHRDFTADFRDGAIVYTFTLPVTGARAKGLGELNLAMFDKTYYVAFALTETDPVKVQAPAGKNASCATRRDLKVETEGYGAIEIEAITCRWGGK